MAKQKPPKKPGPVKRVGRVASGSAHSFVHGKIYENEHENVGIEGAHRSELVGESVLRHGSQYVKRKIREPPAKAVRRAESKYIKATADYHFRMAAEEHPELTVKVFDSKSASIGLGALAVQVARYAVRGVAFDPLCELTKRLINDTVVYFSLDTLEYLQRGGRIGRATALAGGLLQIKPILTFDRKDGMISTAAKVRGRRGVQQRLIELATELAAKHPGEEYNLVVCDGNVPEEGAALEAALIRALPNAHRVLHGKIDATLAVHLGPNLLGVGVQFLNSKLPA